MPDHQETSRRLALLKDVVFRGLRDARVAALIMKGSLAHHALTSVVDNFLLLMYMAKNFA